MKASLQNTNNSTQVLSNAKPFFQPKLTINEPGDQYEQEADAMADKVMRMPMNDQPFFSAKPVGISHVQRKCAHCEEEEKMQRKESTSQPTEASSETSSYINSLSSQGSSLPESARSFFEPRFSHNFSNVKIHTDSEAAKSAQSVNALAYTTGDNIVFNQNQFSPESDNGKKLLAHELTHVVQQREGSEKIQCKEEAKSGDLSFIGDDKFWVMGNPTANGSFPLSNSSVSLEPGNNGFVILQCFVRAGEHNSILSDGFSWRRKIVYIDYEISDDGEILLTDLSVDADDPGAFDMPEPQITINAEVKKKNMAVITIDNFISLTGGHSFDPSIQIMGVGLGGSLAYTTDDTIYRQYKLYLNVKPIEPIKLDPDIRFEVGSSQILEGEDLRLSKWFWYQPETVKNLVRAGKRPIVITGSASTTGTVEVNRKLATGRANKAKAILLPLIGDEGKINTFGIGEIEALSVTGDKVEDERFRKVTVYIDVPK